MFVYTNLLQITIFVNNYVTNLLQNFILISIGYNM